MGIDDAEKKVEDCVGGGGVSGLEEGGGGDGLGVAFGKGGRGAGEEDEVFDDELSGGWKRGGHRERRLALREAWGTRTTGDREILFLF